MLPTPSCRRLVLVVLVLLSSQVVIQAAQASEPAASIEPKRIEAIARMLPKQPVGVGAPIADRAVWQAIAAHPAFKSVVPDARQLLAQPIRPMTDDDYLDYSQTGNRSRGQKVIGERHGRLTDLALAECLENRGKFLAGIEEAIQSVCDEKSWTLPAHDRSLKNFKGVEYDIDLHVAAVGWNLATIDFWLGEKLGRPTRDRIRTELRRRVFDPFESHIKTGKPSMSWVRGTNNWNAVCTAGTIGAALAIIESPADRARYVAAAETNIQRFLDGFTADGYCSEGVGYWNYGFGHYVLLSETLHQATGGQIDLMTRPKVREIALFGRRLEILPGVYPALADCRMGTQPDPVIEAFVLRRFGMALRPDEQQRAGLGVGPGKLLPAIALYGLPNSATAVPAAGAAADRPALRDYFEEAAILVCRAGGDAPARFGAALKGGHNAEHHNHNDVGSFVVAVADATPLVDPGSEVYTARTFSGQRYVSNVLNSFGHPVPRVAGQLQRTGRNAAAKVLSADFNEAADVFALDLTACYDVKTLKRLVRTFQFSRDARGRLTVTDAAEFDRPEAFETALVTYSAWQQIGPNRLRVGEKATAVDVAIDAGGAELKIEPTELKEDVSAKRPPVRLGIVFGQPTAAPKITLTITPSQD